MPAPSKIALKLGCILLMLTSTCCLAGQRDLATAEVHAYREQLSDRVRYTYVITNKGNAPITALEVGYDYYLGEPELRSPRPLRVASLPGWTSRLTGIEEGEQYSISWETGSVPIQPGQMRAGFVVETANPNQQFLASHWTVTVDGPIVSASDRIVHIGGSVPGDTLPPLVTVTANPAQLWPPNGRMESISIRVDVSDDTDPSPTVKLLSVECAECVAGDVADAAVGTDDRTFKVRAHRTGRHKPGRIYVATYEATDASGNAATAQAEIIVPHDLRR